MVNAPEEFFIRKIKEALAENSELLSPEEEEFLRTSVLEIGENPVFTPEWGQALQTKCARALTTAYKRDTGGKDIDAAIRWRKSNEALYKDSQSVISGVVQNWYLSAGRALEKQVGSWPASRKAKVAFLLSLPGVVLGLFGWVAFVMAIMSLREMKQTANSTNKGFAISALIIGGIWGPVRTLLGILARSALVQ